MSSLSGVQHRRKSSSRKLNFNGLTISLDASRPKISAPTLIRTDQSNLDPKIQTPASLRSPSLFHDGIQTPTTPSNFQSPPTPADACPSPRFNSGSFNGKQKPQNLPVEKIRKSQNVDTLGYLSRNLVASPDTPPLSPPSSWALAPRSPSTPTDNGTVTTTPTAPARYNRRRHTLHDGTHQSPLQSHPVTSNSYLKAFPAPPSPDKQTHRGSSGATLRGPKSGSGGQPRRRAVSMNYSYPQKRAPIPSHVITAQAARQRRRSVASKIGSTPLSAPAHVSSFADSRTAIGVPSLYVTAPVAAGQLGPGMPGGLPTPRRTQMQTPQPAHLSSRGPNRRSWPAPPSPVWSEFALPPVPESPRGSVDATPKSRASSCSSSAHSSVLELSSKLSSLSSKRSTTSASSSPGARSVRFADDVSPSRSATSQDEQYRRGRRRFKPGVTDQPNGGRPAHKPKTLVKRPPPQMASGNPSRRHNAVTSSLPAVPAQAHMRSTESSAPSGQMTDCNWGSALDAKWSGQVSTMEYEDRESSSSRKQRGCLAPFRKLFGW